MSETAPDLVSALVAYWAETPGLIRVSPVLYFSEGPENPGGTYCVLHQVGARVAGHVTAGAGRPAWEESTLQFAVYSDDQDEAADQGKAMADILDTRQASPLDFESGYQMAFYRTGSRLTKVPAYGQASATTWQQTYDYRAVVGYR